MKKLIQVCVLALIPFIMLLQPPSTHAASTSAQTHKEKALKAGSVRSGSKKIHHTKGKKRKVKRSKKATYKKKRSKKRYKKARYKKKRSKRSRYKKRYKKARYKKKRRYSKRKSYKKRSKKRYKKARYKKKRRYKKRRVLTCDMLSRSTLLKKSKPYNKAINTAARKYGIDPNLIRSIITVETCFRPKAKGALGEKGLMQLMPATGREYGMKNGFNSWDNIHAGTRFLQRLQRYYGKNYRYMAAAYNGGIGNVSRKSGPKIKAVKRYSKKVLNAYSKFTYKHKRKKYKKTKHKVRKKKSRAKRTSSIASKSQKG